ncbi:MAG: ABC transporter substrate-binding protein [Geobacteraceae bacterium]|nr:ABC transporter substrate-binding protein [Geobacteraceae bacterium]
MRSSVLVALSLFFTLLPAYSASGKKLPSATREVTDMAGRKMVVPSAISRIYVNKPGSVLMYAVAPEMLVSRSLWITDNTRRYLKSSYLQLPYVDGSVEEIVRLRPDIIISSFNINPKTRDEADRLSQKTGIPVFMVPMDMGMYEQTFKVLGELLNRQKQSDRMRAFLHTYFDGIAIKAKQIPVKQRVRVYYAEGERGLNTDPAGSFHSQILDVVGAINVAQVGIASGQGMSAVSIEQLLLWNPDVILVWTGMGSSMTTMHAIKSDNLWAGTRAIKNNKVYQIPFQPFGWFDRPPATNRIMGAIWTAELLYPDIYHYDLKQITREYFDIFYHHQLSDNELAEVLHPNPEMLKQSTSRNH